MSRIVSIWLPEWAIERLRRQTPGSVPEAEPFALVEKGPHGLRISAVNAAARAAGVTVGAALPDVRAAIPGLAVRPAEAARDRKALLALAGWLARYGPASNVDGADAAWVDVTGVPHLFGGEARLCADLAERLGRLGITVRIGLAETLGAAHALARFASMPAVAPWTIAPPGEMRDPLAGLPVAALRLEPAAVRLLVRLGLKRIGQLYGLPRAALAARFRDAGPRAGRKLADTAAASLLLRLDQALGLAGEPRRPLHPPPEALSRLAFPEPLLTSEGVEAALQQLAATLQRQLEIQALGSQRFRLALYRADGTVAAATVGTSTLCREASHVCRLMRERLGSLDAGFGIDVATLDAGRLAPLAARQTGFADGSAGEAGAVAFIDRIASRLGPSCIRLWTAVASHIPERAEVWQPAMYAGDGRRRGEPAAGRQPGDDEGEAIPLVPMSRPPFLLPVPEPISVIAELPEGAPQRFVWRRLARRIVKSDGPERIAPEWWRHIGVAGPPPGTRDYYRLEDATGARYWVFREGLYGRAEADEASEAAASEGVAAPALPRWFVHGLFP